MPRLYHREHAGRPIRVAWVLEELGEPYEVTTMTREQGAGEEHRARHPLGRVPVFEDDDGFVFESVAICLHLADLHPEAGLAPAPGTRERALLYQWSVFVPAELEPPLIESAIYAQSDPERSAKARGRFDKAAGAVSNALDGRDHLVGEGFTVADVLVGSALAFTQRIGFADELPASLRDYMARLAERPARQRAVERTVSG
ncbi:MAG TPA: glutathione S-transferase family protein [Solirubrobacteraceae bacterium]|jgi:glutathione S-transferase|nr:glutathione S-transferase family protein [Solirubrobacteraceae bacterium]